MESRWLCVVISKNLCGRGFEAAQHELARLVGDCFVDFRMVDDGFDGDCYSFLKCRLDMGNFMEGLRLSANVMSVLDTYDSPSYLSDEEIEQFIVDDDDEVVQQLRYGDTVQVGGDGTFSGLKGVVTLAGLGESQVLFRFHTVTLRRWLKNEELILTGNVFSRLKLPVTDSSLLKCRSGKCPVVEERGVSTGKSNRLSHREGDKEQDRGG